MRNTFIIFLLFFVNFSFSQTGNKLKFAPLVIIDQLMDQANIAEIQKDNELQDTRFFIKNWVDKTNTLQKALFYKKDKSYIIFQLPNDDGNFNSFALSDNKRFITYTTDYKFGGRDHYEAKSHFQIIDLQNLSSISLNCFYTTEEKEEEKAAVVSKCESEISVKANVVSVKRKCTKCLNYRDNFNDDCISSGKYKITNGRLLKIKTSH